MAQRIVTQFIDDIDGTAIEGNRNTLTFALEGVAYEIDLTDANAGKLRAALAPFVEAGRPVSPSKAQNASGPRRRGPARVGARDLAAVRDWARGSGYTVSDRGRIPQALLEQYRASQ